MPPPMHIVTTTCFAPRRLPSMSAWPDQPGAAHAVRMADGDRAAVDVEAVVGDAEPIAAVDHLHGERFVQLPEVDVLDLRAGLLEQLRHREHRADAHLVRLAAGDGEAAEDAERRQPFFAAAAALMTTATLAPSENWLALPAEITPPSIAGLIFDTPS